MLAPVMLLAVMMSRPSCQLFPRLLKSKTHRASFWRGGIREPLGFLVSQLAVSLHTAKETTTRPPRTVTPIRCRSRSFIADSRCAKNGIEAEGEVQGESPVSSGQPETDALAG